MTSTRIGPRLGLRLGLAFLAAGLSLGPALAQNKPSQPPSSAMPADGAQTTPAPGSLPRTEVLDRAALERLRRNSGISLQWISWDNSRGHVRVEERDGVVRLRGEQQQRNGPGRLEIDGVVRRIDRTSFVFEGSVVMRRAPEDRAECLRNGIMTFRITGSRRYWRMQEMEACAGLTDYVDIYF